MLKKKKENKFSITLFVDVAVVGKGKGTRYLTSEVPLLSRVLSQEADGALILPPSFHQCSVLRVFKAT